MTIVESGWIVWVWLVCVVSRRQVWLVGVSGNLWVWLAEGGCWWNLWVLLVGVVVRRYILNPTPLVSALFLMFFVLVPVHCCNI